MPYLFLLAAALAAALGYRTFVHTEMVRRREEALYTKLVDGSAPDALLATWTLAGSEEPVRRRFIEDALGSSSALKGLGGRAELAFHAAIGLEPPLRDMVADRLSRLTLDDREIARTGEGLIPVTLLIASPAAPGSTRTALEALLTAVMSSEDHGAAGLPELARAIRALPTPSGGAAARAAFALLMDRVEESSSVATRVPPELAAAVAGRLSPADLSWATLGWRRWRI